MKKTIFKILAGILILSAAVAVIWYWHIRDSNNNETELILYGNVDIRQVLVAFNHTERIAEIKVKEGQRVTKGQLLAKQETVRVAHAVAQAEAATAEQKHRVEKLEAGTRKQTISKVRADLEAAEILAVDAERTFLRLKPLARNDATSKERADHAKAQSAAAWARFAALREELNLALAGPRKEDIAAARAGLEAREAGLALLRQKLAETRLVAPAEGFIQNRILEPGDMAFPNTPVFTLALTDPVWVRTYVPEPDLGKISPAMGARVTTDSYPDKTYEAWVGYISPTAEFTPQSVETPELRTNLVYQVRVYVNNPQNELRLGMPVTVTLLLGQSSKNQSSGRVALPKDESLGHMELP